MLLRSLAEKLGWLTLGRAPAWRRLLTERGLDPLAAHVISHHDALEDAWGACPRADWVLEIAVRGRVEPSLVARGLSEVAASVRAWPLVAAESAAVLEAAGSAWERGELDADALLGAVQPALRELIDREPAVDRAFRALREASRWKQRARIQAAADAYDEAHGDAHWELAERLRRAIPPEALAFALLGQRAHPYR